MPASPTLLVKTLVRHRLVRSLILAFACLQASQWTVLIVDLWRPSFSRPAYQALILSSVLIAITLAATLVSRSHYQDMQASTVGTQLRKALACLLASTIALCASLYSTADVMGYTQPLENGGWPQGDLYATLAIGLLLAMLGALLLFGVVLIQWLDRYLNHRNTPGQRST